MFYKNRHNYINNTINYQTIKYNYYTNITLTTYELTKNNKAFTYTLTDNGYPINYDSNLVDYSFKIGNLDLTNSVSIKDNKLTLLLK
mgnify:CR=1 FL=1